MHPDPGSTPTPADLGELSRRLPGAVGLPDSAIYDRGRTVFAPEARIRRPAAVVRPTRAEDVATVLRWARETGTRVAVRAGGHSFDGFPVQDGRLLLDLGGLNRVEIDADGRLHAEPGATIMDVGRALHAVERALPHGDCPTVALGGLVAGGGFGYATRCFGLTIDFMRRATIVTPDGDSHVASLDGEPDLFWACRGGGGTAGLATELVLDTVAVDRVTGILLCWRWDAAVDGILLYDEILHRAPPELDLKLKIRTTGADRFIDGASAGPPDAIPGTPLMHIDGQFLGGREEAIAHIRPFLDHPALRSHTIQEESYYDAMLQLVPLSFLSDPAPPTIRAARIASDFSSGRLGAREATALVRYIDAFQTEPGLEGGAVLIEPACDAVARLGPEATAFPHRGAEMLFQWEMFGRRDLIGGLGEHQSRLLAKVRDGLGGILTGRRYLNYADFLDTPEAWWGENLPRLERIAAAHDPDRTLISRLYP